eukprot:348561-Pelagomonas_calceolata.AAC.1
MAWIQTPKTARSRWSLWPCLLIIVEKHGLDTNSKDSEVKVVWCEARHGYKLQKGCSEQELCASLYLKSAVCRTVSLSAKLASHVLYEITQRPLVEGCMDPRIPLPPLFCDVI